MQQFGVDSSLNDGPRKAGGRLGSKPCGYSRADDIVAVTVSLVHVEELGAKPIEGPRIDEVTEVALNRNSDGD